MIGDGGQVIGVGCWRSLGANKKSPYAGRFRGSNLRLRSASPSLQIRFKSASYIGAKTDVSLTWEYKVSLDCFVNNS